MSGRYFLRNFCTLTIEYDLVLYFNVGQDNKGTWWMPWCQEPMKDAVRLRKAPVSCQTSLAGDLRMGQPILMNSGYCQLNT